MMPNPKPQELVFCIGGTTDQWDGFALGYGVVIPAGQSETVYLDLDVDTLGDVLQGTTFQ